MVHVRGYTILSERVLVCVCMRVCIFSYSKVLESVINVHEKSLLMLMRKIGFKCPSNSHEAHF